MIPYTTEWNLDFLYSGINDPNLESDISDITKGYIAFSEKFRGKMTELSPSQWLEFFSDLDTVSYKKNKAEYYVFLQESLDSTNEQITILRGRLEHIGVEVANLTLFIDQELKYIGSERLIDLSKHEELAEYSNYFIMAAEEAQHTLSHEVEKVLNDNAPSSVIAFGNLYDEFMSNLTFSLDIDGEIKKLTEDQIRALRFHPKEETRKKSYEVSFETITREDIQITFSNVYKAIVKNATNEAEIRGYEHSRSIRYSSELLDESTVEMLVSSVMSKTSLFARFLKAKAMILGDSTLKSWNVFAPIGTSHSHYSFEEAIKIVMDTFKEFDDEMYQYFIELLTSGKVDVFPKKGKRGGAFCAYLPHLPSVVLLNFTGNESDILTIAHEFGHAYNGFKEQVQPPILQDEPLCMAETASTFNETVIQNKLLKSKTGLDKLAFLDHMLIEITSTIYRQIQYFNFEKRVHDEIAKKYEPTKTDLNTWWRQTKEEICENTIDYSDKSPTDDSTWISVPHIFRSPFYVSAYAFGLILSHNIYHVYLQDIERYRNIYSKILQNGYAKRPADILLECGFDINSSVFYTNSFDYIESLVDEYEALAKEYKKS